jgi:U6 snRNA-associated Sm-like protein LSm6
MSSSKISPGDFLKSAIGKEVRVRLNNGSDYSGNLACLDGFMNIAMENTREHSEGRNDRSFGDSFLRGNNVMYITVTSTAKTE